MNETCILQVEDDANDVFLLQRAFLEVGINNPVQVATDGETAIEYLQGTGVYANRVKYPLPGLVLLNLKLPRISGREVLQWIRSRPGLKRMIVIVFTSAQYAGDIGLAYELGASSFVFKPTDFTHYSEIARSLKAWWLRCNRFPDLPQTTLALAGLGDVPEPSHTTRARPF
jgi:CheY-like chemotaxis protein